MSPDFWMGYILAIATLIVWHFLRLVLDRVWEWAWSGPKEEIEMREVPDPTRPHLKVVRYVPKQEA